MSIATRKEREFKQREKLILKNSFDMLLDEGYIGFTIDKLAKKIDYAKGTVYKHFSCKEDIIMKILNEAFRQRMNIITRIKFLDLPERGIFVAGSAGMILYNILNPNLHRLIHIANVESIWNKVCRELKEQHNEMIKSIFIDFDQLIQKAVANGNIDLGEHESIDIYYSLICLNIGFSGLLNNGRASHAHIPHNIQECLFNSRMVKDPTKALMLTLNCYMDGLNWRPLSSEYDYCRLREEVTNTVYSDLAEMVKKGEYFDFVPQIET